jgi:hypothetical protein
MLTLRPQNGPPRESSPNTTMSTLYNLEAAPTWIRLIYIASNVAYPIDGAAIATTSAVHDGFTPVNHAGQPDDGLWRRVTFNHNGDDSSPGAQSASPIYSLNVPYRKYPVWGFSDWVRIDPLPRSDGGYGFLVQTRTWSRGVFRTTSDFWQQTPDQSINRAFAAFKSAGDGTTAPWHFAGEPDHLTACYGLQYVSANPGATVIGIGDSIMLPPGSIPYCMRACALVSTPDRPVSYVNEGYLGRKSPDYLAAGAAGISVLHPQVAVIQTFTNNDPAAPDQAERSFNGAMRVAEQARKQQCVPILVTDAPETGISDAAEAIRQDSLKRTRAMASKGFHVLDLDALWGVGGSLDAYKPHYAADRWHPNNAASVVAAEALVPILRQVLGGG